MSLRILAESGARPSLPETAHGPVEPPASKPVATRGAIPTPTDRGAGTPPDGPPPR